MLKPTLQQLTAALHASWGDDTHFSEVAWTPDNPARSQCVVSSLVVQDYFGGDLIRYKVRGEGIDETHYCNRLADGTVLDTTAQQYHQSVILTATPVNLKGYSSIREKRLAEPETRERYLILRDRVAQR